MPKLLIATVLLVTSYQLLVTPPTFARTTPQDIIDTQLESYNSKLQTYSPQSKLKLETASGRISDLNKKITSDWEANCLRQGEILEEYIRRFEIEEKKLTDGKTRNLSNEVENARYWLTYAHEAAAYQAANKYIFNLTSENNINSDINSKINQMSGDLNILRGKVLKSQKIIENLVSS